MCYNIERNVEIVNLLEMLYRNLYVKSSIHKQCKPVLDRQLAIYEFGILLIVTQEKSIDCECTVNNLHKDTGFNVNDVE